MTDDPGMMQAIPPMSTGRKVWPPDPDADTPASEDDDKGLRCLKCGCRDLRVTHVRDAPAKGRWRRRVCRHCGAVRSTYER